jgi:hypothetical protein
MNPSLLLIPSGGKTNLEGTGDSPPIATVMAAELRELGVPSTAIIEETQSFTTQEHFVHCPRDCPRAPLEGDRDRNTRAVLAIWKNYIDDEANDDTALVSEQDFATVLDRRLKRFEEMKVRRAMFVCLQWCLIGASAGCDHYPTGRDLAILGLPLAANSEERCWWLE